MQMDCLLKMSGITKRFPGVVALSDVNIDVLPGEVHAVVGENGAGKSTLMKIMNGVYQPDEGTISVNGKEVQIENSHQALGLGISIVFQEFNLCDHITVANNIFIGRMKNRFGIVDDRWLQRQTQDILDSLEVNVRPNQIVGSLSVAEKQMVEIAKAISTNARIIVFDEPTSSLTDKEITQLFKVIRALREKGCGIFYISHRMEELPQIADRVTVLRDGKHIATHRFEDVTIPSLITEMVGRELSNQYPVKERTVGDVYFEVKNIVRKKKIHVEGFTLRRGEILGVAGLIGSGRTETMRAIFGADPVDAKMEVRLDGKLLHIKNPRMAIDQGIAYLTEDRKMNGLALTMDVERNINMASHKLLSRYYVMNDKQARENALRFVSSLSIKTPGIRQKTQYLSGGNQQKVVLAKWLYRNAKVVIFDEPTRGIDVGSKYEIYKLMNDLSDQGIGIIMISSELPEVLGMSDRILVFHNGSIAAELDRADATQVRILEYATAAVRTAGPDDTENFGGVNE